MFRVVTARVAGLSKCRVERARTRAALCPWRAAVEIQVARSWSQAAPPERTAARYSLRRVQHRLGLPVVLLSPQARQLMEQRAQSQYRGAKAVLEWAAPSLSTQAGLTRPASAARSKSRVGAARVEVASKSMVARP